MRGREGGDDKGREKGDVQMATAVSALLAMYLSGLNGSCFGSVNTHGTGMFTACAGAARPAKQTRAAHSGARSERESGKGREAGILAWREGVQRVS